MASRNKRIYERGWDMIEAITTPNLGRGGVRNTLGYKEKYLDYVDVCNEMGQKPISYSLFCKL